MTYGRTYKSCENNQLIIAPGFMGWEPPDKTNQAEWESQDGAQQYNC